MTKLLFVTSILFATLSLTLTPQAQTGPTGTWRVDGVGPALPWTLILRENGPKLTGTVSNCGWGTPLEIYEGSIDGSTVSFECRRPNGTLTIAFTGTINGDEIEFKWKNMGPADVAADHGMFGASAPPQFIAKRFPDGPIAEAAARAIPDPAVDFDRIVHADQDPQNWLTYSGQVNGQRHSPLSQITPGNVKNLELAWLWQTKNPDKFETTSLVVNGVLYTVQADTDVFALDAQTGRELWEYSYTPASEAGGYGRINRGLAILGDKLFMGTRDAHLLAINASTGKLIWNTTVPKAADPACQGGRRICYSITHAPLIVKDKVIVGVGGGDAPIRGFIAAFDAATGQQVWRFNTIPAPGEPGNETWPGDSWKTGGVGVWNTGTYDPDLNLTYWGTGNPYPIYDGDVRRGDNLYGNSVVALDADTGKLRWHYQFTPHDVSDWDAAQVPILTEIEWQGRQRQILIQATKNGLMYVLDRATGEFLRGNPFVEVNWMSGFDPKGRPQVVTEKLNSPEGTLPLSATNWEPPSYSPNTGLFYISSWELRPPRSNTPGYGAIRAFDPRTGEKKWEFRRNDAIFTAGALTTASDLLFTGDTTALGNAYFYALNARTGERLWDMSLAGNVQSGPMSYSAGGKQYIAVAAGNTLFALALRQ